MKKIMLLGVLLAKQLKRERISDNHLLSIDELFDDSEQALRRF